MRLILTTSLVTLSLLVHAQSKVDLTYFAFGLVNDYSGRQLVLTDSLELKKVDRCHETEIDILNYLDSLVRVENSFRAPDNQIDRKIMRESDCGNCQEFVAYYSKRLADDLNGKHRFKFNETWDGRGRKNYSGLIKKTAIKSREQRLSFLAGAYLRYGQREGKLYKFSFANSERKFRMIRKSLRRTRCKIISIKTIKDRLPNSQHLEFIPTKELKSEFDRLDVVKGKVESKKGSMSRK
jgi:hypothetical protein